eukprot:79898_1
MKMIIYIYLNVIFSILMYYMFILNLEWSARMPNVKYNKMFIWSNLSAYKSTILWMKYYQTIYLNDIGLFLCHFICSIMYISCHMGFTQFSEISNGACGRS